MKTFREAKSLLYVVLFSIFFWQLYQAALKLQSGQLTTKISYDVKPSFKVPSISVCHLQKYNNINDSDTGKNLTELMEEAEQRTLVTRANIVPSSDVETLLKLSQW